MWVSGLVCGLHGKLGVGGLLASLVSSSSVHKGRCIYLISTSSVRKIHG